MSFYFPLLRLSFTNYIYFSFFCLSSTFLSSFLHLCNFLSIHSSIMLFFYKLSFFHSSDVHRLFFTLFIIYLSFYFPLLISSFTNCSSYQFLSIFLISFSLLYSSCVSLLWFSFMSVLGHELNITSHLSTTFLSSSLTVAQRPRPYNWNSDINVPDHEFPIAIHFSGQTFAPPFSHSSSNTY